GGAAEVCDDAAHRRSPVDEAAYLPRRQRRRCEAARVDLPHDALEDLRIAEVVSLELAVPPGHELLDRLGEVGRDVLDQADDLPAIEAAPALEVDDEIVQGTSRLHGSTGTTWTRVSQELYPISGIICQERPTRPSSGI